MAAKTSNNVRYGKKSRAKKNTAHIIIQEKKWTREKREIELLCSEFGIVRIKK